MASKVIGKVKWIGVDKGDQVKEGQVLVRLEDDEYQAQLLQAKGQLANLQAKLREMQNGSRPEEIAAALANLNAAKADLGERPGDSGAHQAPDRRLKWPSPPGAGRRARRATTRRTRRSNRSSEPTSWSSSARARSRSTPLRGQVEQARGAVAYAETKLANTIIRAPVTGTILERAVEKGEFVTTSFVGDHGAKGYVVSLADLNDLEVELDISQNDFAKLRPRQHGIVTTDAFPDRKYDGFIKEISPEANRQKATVQVKVKVVKPDDYLRPEMNASVAFVSDEKPHHGCGVRAKPVIVVPASAVHDGAVFVVLDGKAVRRPGENGPGHQLRAYASTRD